MWAAWALPEIPMMYADCVGIHGYRIYYYIHDHLKGGCLSVIIRNVGIFAPLNRDYIHN